jgi:hypothetical protein
VKGHESFLARQGFDVFEDLRFIVDENITFLMRGLDYCGHGLSPIKH